MRKTLYVQRKVLNADEILRWARIYFDTTLKPDDLHVTVAFSRAKVDWDLVKSTDSIATVNTKFGKRSVSKLGDKGAVVLKFESTILHNRWEEILRFGASWDYDSYTPHISITYNGDHMEPSDIPPYDGVILLGPELMSEVVDNWDETIEET